MTTIPDPKYLPKPKTKSKIKKMQSIISESSFPKINHKVETRPMKKKKSPNGDHYVWSK
jgi:hypothetical protein